MNMSPRLAMYLQEIEVDCLHWSKVGPATSTDREIAEFTVSNGMVVVTHDLDFGALLAAAGTQLPSVIQIRADDLSVEALGAKLAEVVNTLANELSAGALVTLDPPNIRFRVLPIIRQ
jgi:predicted nuclease of predicted toxin-antitoxin system